MKETCIVDAVCRLTAIDSKSLQTLLGFDFNAPFGDGRRVSLNFEDVYRVLAISSIGVYSTQRNAKRWMTFHEGIYADLSKEHAVYFKAGMVYDNKLSFPLPVAEYLELQPLSNNYMCFVRYTKQLAKDLRYVTV